MTYTIVGLGNSGEAYEGTRHNTGRMILEAFRHTFDFSEWKTDPKKQAHISRGVIGKHTVILVLPDLFMNQSGIAVRNFVKSTKAAERLVVVYDELDLPLGRFKIAFARGSGGHKGVLSIEKKLQTNAFVRLRVGITPTTPTGKLKKPKGEEKVVAFILGSFTPGEQKMLTKIKKDVVRALESIVTEGRMSAMNRFN